MFRSRNHSRNCSVIGCNEDNPMGSYHTLPKDNMIRREWLDFIFHGSVPAEIGSRVFVCSRHFTPDLFVNWTQFNSGFATKLILREGVIPTVLETTSKPRPSKPNAGCSSVLPSAGDHMGCQTDPMEKIFFGTQQSNVTLGPHQKNAAVQATVNYHNTSMMTEPIAMPLTSLPVRPRAAKRRRVELDEEEDGVRTEIPNLRNSSGPAQKTSYESAKYIVYESCLLELFEECPVCQMDCEVRSRSRGTFLAVEQLCPHCKYFRQWKSQPIVGSTPAGNLQLSAAIYFTGASFFSLEKVFRAMRLKMFNKDTFRKHCTLNLEPAIVHKWRSHQDALLQQLAHNDKNIIGGDMMVYSPGHSAQFGSYSVMHLESNNIIDIQLVQSHEVGCPRLMEKEGLKRSLELFKARRVPLDCIVTKQQRPHIEKFLRELNIKQLYDVQPLVKGVSKQLRKIVKDKQCAPLKEWLRTITNHMYWAAVSSHSGPMKVAKWTSLVNHLQNIHSHEDPLFPKCAHPDYISRDRAKWLKPGSKSVDKLKKLVTNKRILKAVEKLSPHYQTTSLQSFRHVILHFTPGTVVSPFLEKLCRLYLAAMYFNENTGRPRETPSCEGFVSSGETSKSKKEGYTAQPVTTKSTFDTLDYVDDLMGLLFEKVLQEPRAFTDELLKIPVPEELRSPSQRRE